MDLIGSPALRNLAAVAMALLALATLALGLAPLGNRTKRRWSNVAWVLLAALALRAAFSVVQDGGGYDIFVAYRGLGGVVVGWRRHYQVPGLGSGEDVCAVSLLDVETLQLGRHPFPRVGREAYRGLGVRLIEVVREPDRLVATDLMGAHHGVGNPDIEGCLGPKWVGQVEITEVERRLDHRHRDQCPGQAGPPP